MTQRKYGCAIGCFLAIVLSVLCVFLIYEFGTRPTETKIDGVPIEAWLSHVVMLEGGAQQEAISRLAAKMQASLGPGDTSATGILGPGSVARNKQMRTDAESIRTHFASVEALFHKAMTSRDIATRRATIQAAPFYFIWASDTEKVSMCELLVVACKDNDLELAAEARRTLIDFVTSNPLFDCSEVGGIFDLLETAG